MKIFVFFVIIFNFILGFRFYADIKVIIKSDQIKKSDYVMLEKVTVTI